MPVKDHKKWKAYQRAWAAAKGRKIRNRLESPSRKYRAANLDMVREEDRERKKRAKAEVP